MVKIIERMYGFIKLNGNEPVLITQCYRCFGGLMVCRKKSSVLDEDLPQSALFVYHIPPSKDAEVIKRSTEQVIKKLLACLEFYTIEAFYRCGGNIDTDENKEIYHLMKEHLEKPIRSFLPSIPLQGIEPNKNTFYSTILFDENQKVSCQEFGGKDAYKESVLKEA